MPQNNSDFKLDSLKDDMFNMMKEDKKQLAKINRNYFVIILVLIITLFTTNAYWIWNNSQWEYETTTEIGETKDNGTAIINSGEGDVTIGKGGKDNSKKDKGK